MFTGIIQSVGEIQAIEKRGEDSRVSIATNTLDMSDLQIGDSIAVNGVCLTAIEFSKHHFQADVSNETLACSTFSKLKPAMNVNLEKALTASTRLGGHLVSGHVDGIGELVKRYDDGRSVRFIIKIADHLAKYVATKGSICVDGVSLTVNHVDGNEFGLNIVPHTLQQTTMHHFHSGTSVNIEVDVIARYLERLMLGESAAEKGKRIDHAFLTAAGFIK